MLPRSRRVHTRSDYQLVFTTSRPYRGANMLLSVAPAEGPSRFGIIVGKRFSAKAVRRNRLKRQLRAIVTGHLAHVKPGHLAVINATRCGPDVAYRALAGELGALFEKAGIV